MIEKAPIKVYDFSEKDNYQNKHELAPQWPFRLLICGSSGTGKTNLVLNLIYEYICFNRIYLYAKDLEEDKYKDLIDNLTTLESKCKTNILTVSNDLNDIVDVDDLDPKYQNLIIFDDFVTENDQKKIEDLFIRGRKRNASIIYLSQSYFKTPKIIRENCNYFAFFKCSNPNEIRLIQQHHAFDVKKDKFLKYFGMATKGFDFFLIDRKTMDKTLRYRKNFEKIVD